jgi:predicted CXXCH cytochrome family protein
MKLSSFISALLLLGGFQFLSAQDKEACLECHSDAGLVTERGGQEVSLFVNMKVLSKSIHKKVECISCHTDAAVEEFPHPENLQPVVCANCHDDAQLDFAASIHGLALNRKAPYAPTCTECHGTHNILTTNVPESPTFKMNIPYLCGKCHREGAPVANVYNISEHNILENYSESIHGEGLFKKGLIVTAACTDCHGSHMILPHTLPKSTISLHHVAGTCMKCHSRIEQVHQKVIRGELWEKRPGAIPACTDCHQPHRLRRGSLVLNVADRDCMRCHEKDEVYKMADGKSESMFVSKREIENSVHKNIPCVKCHSDIDPKLSRPCETADHVDCSNCHAKMAEEYFQSGHGQAHFEKKYDAPYCTTCHGKGHTTKSRLDDASPTYRAAIPSLCGDCHKKGGKAAVVPGLAEINVFYDYSSSVHGKGLTEKGLLPVAICTDCHNSHYVLKHTDERSAIHPKNIPATCATCHRGIYKEFIKSVHYSTDGNEKQKLPTCMDCHSAHGIARVEQDAFMNEVTQQCGSCHEDLAKTYFDTMHGKAYQLGYLKAAKCSDCHGAHAVLSVNDPNSSVGLSNVVKTCQKCHEDANRRFTGYLTHATHHDKVKYPILFYTYWGMTALLVGVFGFFGIHTLLWLPRSFTLLKEKKKQPKEQESRYYIQRFTLAQRITHLFVIISFMSLALTGMMLKFSSMPWAGFVADLLGGVAVAGTIHRTAAVITFGYFFYHLYTLFKNRRRHHKTWRQIILGASSLWFNKQDVRDFVATVKWFFGKGERPAYGRWTYWEKFDYMAVFWGVAIIGTSGLMLWFPEFFTKILPGWLINVATIVHSDEALLAVGFIFTVHFFNTHLRPEAFPMDTVIFTGVVPVEEYKATRPREYEALKESGALRKVVVSKKIPPKWEKAIHAFGFLFLSLGVILIGLIIYSVLFGYR